MLLCAKRGGIAVVLFNTVKNKSQLQKYMSWPQDTFSLLKEYAAMSEMKALPRN